MARSAIVNPFDSHVPYVPGYDSELVDLEYKIDQDFIKDGTAADSWRILLAETSRKMKPDDTVTILDAWTAKRFGGLAKMNFSVPCSAPTPSTRRASTGRCALRMWWPRSANARTTAPKCMRSTGCALPSPDAATRRSFNSEVSPVEARRRGQEYQRTGKPPRYYELLFLALQLLNSLIPI